MKNSQATFQRMMNKCLTALEGVGIYVDDIVIHSNSWSEHLKRLEADRLAAANVTVNLTKSDFGHAKVIYLGHVVCMGKVTPVEAKIKCIAEYPIPENRKGLMRFLGMAGYYKKFCKNFSDIAVPLKSKDQKYHWTSNCHRAFDNIKSLLCLVAPDFCKLFILNVDVSDTGVGAILLQADDEGIEHPVCYFSKKFSKHQRNYSTIDKETLALILALQHYEVNVSSFQGPTLVYTDHNLLTFLHKMKNKNRRRLNWSLLLQDYNLEIKHIKGKDNVCADALSRC